MATVHSRNMIKNLTNTTTRHSPLFSYYIRQTLPFLFTLRVHTCQPCHNLLSEQRDSLVNFHIYSSDTPVPVCSTHSYLPTSSCRLSRRLYHLLESCSTPRCLPPLLETQRHKGPPRIASNQLPPLPTGRCCDRTATRLFRELLSLLASYHR